MAAAGLGGLALLGGLLATCGPSGGSAGALVPEASPSGSQSDRPNSSPSQDLSAFPGVGLSPTAGPGAESASPSPSPSASPSATPSDSPEAESAASGDGSDQQGAQSQTARQHSRPRPAVPPRPGPHTGAGRPSSAATEVFPSLRVCAEAERLGEWAPGSEQAKLCRSLYGS